MNDLVCVGWRVMGERPDGSEIEGDTFPNQQKAEHECALLLMEFPDNIYWAETRWELLL